MPWRLAITVLTITAGPSTAQPSSSVAVDQAVADLDLLTTGLRRVQRGLRLDGEHTSLFRLAEPGTRLMGDRWNRPPAGSGSDRAVYHRLAPGLRAQVDRIDYLVPRGRGTFAGNVAPIVDGRFIEIFSANTVFVLRPRRTHTPQPFMAGVDHRIDTRIAGRIDSRLDGRISPTWPPPAATAADVLGRVNTD